MESILNSVNKSIEEKWAPILKANPKKKFKSSESQNEPTPKASCSFSNPETIDQNLEEISNSDNFDSEAEEFSSDREILKSALNKKKKFHVSPKIIFSPENIPKLISEHMQVSQPLTKISSFSVHVSDNTISLVKGQMKNPIATDKFDVTTRDSEMSDIFSRVNSRYSVYDIPENCFSISPSNRF